MGRITLVVMLATVMTAVAVLGAGPAVAAKPGEAKAGGAEFGAEGCGGTANAILAQQEKRGGPNDTGVNPQLIDNFAAQGCTPNAEVCQAAVQTGQVLNEQGFVDQCAALGVPLI